MHSPCPVEGATYGGGQRQAGGGVTASTRVSLHGTGCPQEHALPRHLGHTLTSEISHAISSYSSYTYAAHPTRHTRETAAAARIIIPSQNHHLTYHNRADTAQVEAEGELG